MKNIKNAHKHDHCKHLNLRFCVQCNTPHCLDCGEEWNKERIVYQSYPMYQYQAPVVPFVERYVPTWCPTIIYSGTAAPMATSGYVTVSDNVPNAQCLHLEN